MKPVTKRQVSVAFEGVIESIRKDEKAVSQEVLAAELDTDCTNPSLAERAKCCPSLWIMFRYALALDIAPDLLVKMVWLRMQGAINE